MTTNCSECIHDEVCCIKDKFYEIQGMCEEADNKYKEFSISFNCKFYKEECTNMLLRTV